METVLENILPQGTLSKSELNVAKPKWLKVKLPIGQKYTELVA
jgi:lipoic acid synthetase